MLCNVSYTKYNKLVGKFIEGRAPVLWRNFFFLKKEFCLKKIKMKRKVKGERKRKRGFHSFYSFPSTVC